MCITETEKKTQEQKAERYMMEKNTKKVVLVCGSQGMYYLANILQEMYPCFEVIPYGEFNFGKQASRIILVVAVEMDPKEEAWRVLRDLREELKKEPPYVVADATLFHRDGREEIKKVLGDPRL